MSNPENRWVFDTNALVSALLLEQSIPGKAFHGAHGKGNLLVSQATVTELSEVLSRPKFDRYLEREERDQFLITLLREATIVDILETVRACRDPKDDKFLELAVNGQASCLITGDADLLALHPFRGIPIQTPAEFVELLTKQDS